MSHLVNRLTDLREPYRCPRLNGQLPKASYRSRAKAKLAVRLILGHGGPRLHAYQCVRCQYWHLSSERPRSEAWRSS